MWPNLLIDVFLDVAATYPFFFIFFIFFFFKGIARFSVIFFQKQKFQNDWHQNLSEVKAYQMRK